VVVARASRWYTHPTEGEEPDYRFTLANERTFLAWVRTGLGLLAGGVAVRQLADPFGVEGSRTVLSLLAITASIVFVVGAYLRWVAVQRAVRLGVALPAARLVPVAAALVVGIAAFALVVVVVG
jgi:putative membrane protein